MCHYDVATRGGGAGDCCFVFRNFSTSGSFRKMLRDFYLKNNCQALWFTYFTSTQRNAHFKQCDSLFMQSEQSQNGVNLPTYSMYMNSFQRDKSAMNNCVLFNSCMKNEDRGGPY